MIKKVPWRRVNRPIVHLLLIMFCAFLPYAATFDVPFMLDDYGNIAINPDVTELSAYKKILSFDRTPLFKSRSVGNLTFALNYAAHGLDVRGYHLVNILIHLAVSLFLYSLVMLTFKTPCFLKSGEDPSSWAGSRTFMALFTALLFAVHPVQTQAVTYIVQRFASLATLFWLVSLVSYVRFRLLSGQPTATFRRPLLYALSLLTAVLAMKTKEFALLLPLVIVLYELMFLEGRLKERCAYLAPLCLTMAIVPLTVVFTAGGLLRSHEKMLGSTIARGDYLLTQFRVIATYLRLLLFPVNQRFDYDYPVFHSFFNPEVAASFLLLLSIVLTGVFFSCRSRTAAREKRGLQRMASFGIFWFFITLSVESSVISFPDVIFEHRLYLPSIGFFLTMVSLIGLLRVQWRRAAYATTVVGGAMVLLTACLAGATYARNAVWRDKIGFMEDEVRKSPGKDRPRITLGNLYGCQGRIDEALYQFKTAAANHPESADAHYYLGMTYARMGRVAEAVQEYKNTLVLRFDNAEAYFGLGGVYARQGFWNEAVREYTTVIALAPQSEAAHNNRGNAYRTLGRMEEALNDYRAALRINPDFAEAHYNLGNTLTVLGRVDEAKNEYITALRIRPDFVEARRQLGK